MGQASLPAQRGVATSILAVGAVAVTVAATVSATPAFGALPQRRAGSVDARYPRAGGLIQDRVTVAKAST